MTWKTPELGPEYSLTFIIDIDPREYSVTFFIAIDPTTPATPAAAPAARKEMTSRCEFCSKQEWEIGRLVIPEICTYSLSSLLFEGK